MIDLSTCPWSSFAQEAPEFCEAAVCAWIREPGNTWSNLGFVIAALLIYRETAASHRHLRSLGHITLLTGIGSALFHATGTLWGVRADYLGMHLGGAFMMSACVQRWTGWSGTRARVLFWLLFTSAFVPGAIVPSLLRPFYAFDGILCSALELTLFFTRARARDYRWLWMMWVFFVPAMSLWYLDWVKVWCDPDRHWISGHALWHVLNAAGFYAGFRYYRQFAVLRA